MGEEIAFKIRRLSDFQGFMTLTLTLDRVILHTVMRQSSTSTYIPNFIKIEDFLWMDGRTGGWTFESHLIRSTCKSRPKNGMVWVVSGHSRSQKIAPFDKAHMSAYLHSIVTMSLSCMVLAVIMCLPVCLSQAGTVPKQINAGSQKQRRTIAQKV